MKKYADFENVCGKPLRLMKKYADFEDVCAKALRLKKKYADFEKGVQKMKNNKWNENLKLKENNWTTTDSRGVKKWKGTKFDGHRSK